MKPDCPPILLYHHVSEGEETPPPRFPGSYVSAAELTRQLDELARRGFTTRTLADALSRPSSGRSVVLTFDDGCDCFRRRVAPELARRGMTATVFAVADRLGDSNRWDEVSGERREVLMDGSVLRDLAAAGIEIGCHSATHRDLTGLDAAALRDEVEGARARLADVLGKAPATFCYPYGRFDRASREAVEEAGFAAAVSVWGFPGADRNDRLALPRVVVEPGESGASFRLKTSPAYPWIRRLPRLGLLSALRRGEAAG